MFLVLNCFYDRPSQNMCWYQNDNSRSFLHWLPLQSTPKPNNVTSYPAETSITQNTIPAERVSSLAANQVCSPCFIQGHFLLWFLDSGCADVCTPLSAESFGFSDSFDAQHPQNNTVSSWQKGHKSGFSENTIFFPSCWILFAAPLPILRSFKMTSFQVCHQINSTILLFFFFFQSKKY